MRAPGFIRLFIFALIILGTVFAARAGAGTAFAQSAEGQGFEAFSQAVRAYDSGDLNKASGLLDQAFQAGLSKDISARAILLRAMINERSGALARSLQDYSNALWMGTLPTAEQKIAAEGKQRVIAAMGLSTPAQKQAGAASPAPQAASGSSSGVFGMFGSVFGSSEPAPAPPPQQVASPPAPQAERAEAPVPAKSAAKEAEAKPAKPAAPKKAAQKEKPPAPVKTVSIQRVAMAPAASAGGFLIVFGQASSEGAGRTKAQQIKAALSDILVSRELDVEASPHGGFQITAGPYKAKSAALALCSAMKQRGVACTVTP